MLHCSYPGRGDGPDDNSPDHLPGHQPRLQIFPWPSWQVSMSNFWIIGHNSHNFPHFLTFFMLFSFFRTFPPFSPYPISPSFPPFPFYCPFPLFFPFPRSFHPLPSLWRGKGVSLYKYGQDFSNKQHFCSRINDRYTYDHMPLGDNQR